MSMREKRKPAPIRSDTYKVERFGILNQFGQFWTPDTFPSEEAAVQHMRAYWGFSAEKAEEFIRGAKVIPVIVTVEDARP